MRMSFLATCITALAAAACSSSGDGRGSSPDASTSDGRTPEAPDGAVDASDGALGDGCSSAPVQSVPDQWVRPADCAGVGNLCSEGCGSAACQLLGNVCVPFAGIGASPTSCAPYCLADSCMGFDQASCFCTGDAGAQDPRCACGPPAVAGLCAGEGASCANVPCCACQGLACVTDAVSGTVCRQPCSTNSDCATGCCNTSAHRCQDALYCTCVDAGTDCQNGNVSCCPGSTCLTFSADGGGPFTCYTDCTKQSDCTTGCCSQNIPGSNHGACGPCQ